MLSFRLESCHNPCFYVCSLKMCILLGEVTGCNAWTRTGWRLGNIPWPGVSSCWEKGCRAQFIMGGGGDIYHWGLPSSSSLFLKTCQSLFQEIASPPSCVVSVRKWSGPFPTSDIERAEPVILNVGCTLGSQGVWQKATVQDAAPGILSSLIWEGDWTLVLTEAIQVTVMSR